ncbi:MAG: acyltransferase [Anaerolineae bacterium]|nr:acyltransferase [Anaerolineae bacterium]
MSTDKTQSVYKRPMLERLNNENESAFKKYQGFFVGSTKFSHFLQYELLTFFLGPMPGAAGLFLRQKFYPSMFKQIGKGVVFGRNVNLRYTRNIILHDRVALDDGVLIDAKDCMKDGIEIGKDVLIARDTIIQGKGGDIKIEDGASIGSQCQFASIGGIYIGKGSMIAGQTYVGGGRYRTEDINTPIKEQEMYSKGPTIIEDDVWIGAGCVIQDGVHIGKGSVVGSGSIVMNDIPEYTIAVPHQRLVMMPREKA